MSNAACVPHCMTVADFQDWVPETALAERRWNLVDGEPICMAPTSENHGAIQSEAAYLITQYLRTAGSPCRVITAPGVIPRVRSISNERIPDLGITCSLATGARAITDPVVLIEILSPSNEAQTRANVWAYATIPSVMEILLLSSTSISGELLRRNSLGHWADDPLMLDAGSQAHLASIGCSTLLRDFYVTTSLAAQ